MYLFFIIKIVSYGGTPLQFSKINCLIPGTKFKSAFVPKPKQRELPGILFILIYTIKFVCESKNLIGCMVFCDFIFFLEQRICLLINFFSHVVKGQDRYPSSTGIKIKKD